MSITPNLLYVGQQGLFTLASPFSTVYTISDELLTVTSIQSIGQLIANNVNIMNVYFQPYGLNQTQYTSFLNSNGVIVALQNSGGQTYYVPSTFISSLPNPNGVQYRYMGLNVVLGPLKVNYAMSTLIDTLNTIIGDLIGITPSITPVELSPVKLISLEQSDQIEAIRNANINSPNSITYYQNQLNIAQQQIDSLENFIIQNFGTSGLASLINVGTNSTGTISATSTSAISGT